MNEESCVVKELTVWFRQKLEQSRVKFGDEPLSYEANSRYDLQFYRLQEEAAAHWRARYGFAPTPGQLMQGFFGAEYERFRQQKLDGLPRAEKIRRGAARVLRSLSRIVPARAAK